MFVRAVCFWMLAAVLGAEESRFLSRVRQITFEGARAGEGYFSPDGNRIIFQSERESGNPFYQIYILDLTSGETHRVSPGTGKTTCAYFRPPDGGRVLFASTHGDPRSKQLQEEELEFRASGKERRYAWDYDPHFDIYESSADGSGLQNLTDAEGYDAEAAYSPDGQWIVFCSNRSAYPAHKLSPEDRKRLETDAAYFGEIYLMKSDGTGVTRLTDAPGYDGGPFFTPDGKRIVWRHFDEHGVIADVFTMNLDGSDRRQVTAFGSMSWAPYFHPSGEYLVFASNRLGFANFEVFLVDREGMKDPVQVTSTDGFDGLPVFSPDGKRLAWTSSRHGGKGAQLYLAEWNDSAAREALEAAPARIMKSGDVTSHDSGEAPSSVATISPDTRDVNSGSRAFESEVTEADLRTMVEHLASEQLEGRLTGTAGERAAGDFIAARFKEIGLTPLNASEYRSEFKFTSGVRAGGGNALGFKRIEANPHVELAERLKKASESGDFKRTEDFLPLSFTDNGTTEGLLAFAGYGLVVPSEAGGPPVYDSYAGLDVKDRIVIVLRYVPEALAPERRQLFNRYAGLRFKALQARSRGAAGILVVEGPNSPSPGKLVALNLELGGATSGILGASISLETAERLLAGTGRSLKDLQAELDSGESTTAFGIEDTVARIETELVKETGTGGNILGVLPPKDGLKDDTEYVILGAHYDHLGRGPNSSSLARKDEEQLVHHGADDNASGVAAILEVAEALAADSTPRRRGVIFAAWSGEEIGLLGSSAFCNKPPFPLERITANLNLDMVGRVRDNKLVIQAVGSSSVWKGMIERKNIAAGFALSLSDDPYLPTDVTSFYTRKVPGLHFFSGAHDDYHRPTDTAEKINYPDLVRVAELVAALTRELANADARPDWIQVAQAAAPGGGGRDTMRAYLGTIPDYAAEDVVGVKLSGVRAGGPADKGGMQTGDVIVEFAGQTIKNVYDYTYALDAVKIGEPVKIVVLRGDQRVTVTVTPEARK